MPRYRKREADIEAWGVTMMMEFAHDTQKLPRPVRDALKEGRLRFHEGKEDSCGKDFSHMELDNPDGGTGFGYRGDKLIFTPDGTMRFLCRETFDQIYEREWPEVAPTHPTTIGDVRAILRLAERQGAVQDKPEGSRYIQISTTLVDRMINALL